MEKGFLLNLKISPNASKNEIFKIVFGSFNVKIKAHKVEVYAYKELVEFISKTFKIPKTSIEIVKGETSKDKTVLFKTDDIEKIEKIKAAFIS